jgi:hypothetical protein
MSARRARAADWQAVAEIRQLQSRAAEMAAIDAANARRRAAEQNHAAEDALADAHRGWADALVGAFDPWLARHWFARVGDRQSEADAADAALETATGEAERSNAAWHTAEVRAEAAVERRRIAVADASRARDEARLGEIEDRAARQEKRS